MTERDGAIRPDEVADEAEKAKRTIWVGEGLLWRLHEAAVEAEVRHRHALGKPLPKSAGEGDSGAGSDTP